MLSRFWYRQFMACFGLWLVGIVVLAVTPAEKWVMVVFVCAGLAASVVSMFLAFWMTRCPHCKWRLWFAVSRGRFDPDGVFTCPRCGKPIKLK